MKLNEMRKRGERENVLFSFNNKIIPIKKNQFPQNGIFSFSSFFCHKEEEWFEQKIKLFFE